MLLHPAKAEEVVEEAFISAYRGLENFHGDLRFGTWLLQLVVDRAKSMKQLEKTICALNNRQGLEGPADKPFRFVWTSGELKLSVLPRFLEHRYSWLY